MTMTEYQKRVDAVTADLDEIAQCAGVSTFRELLLFPEHTPASKKRAGEILEVLRKHKIDIKKLVAGVNQRYEIAKKQALEYAHGRLAACIMLQGSTILTVACEQLYNGEGESDV